MDDGLLTYLVNGLGRPVPNDVPSQPNPRLFGLRRRLKRATAFRYGRTVG